MLELVRMQNRELPAVVGAEEQIYMSSKMFQAERKKLNDEQRYVERMTHSIPYPQVKKIAYFKNHIWGL